MTIVNETASPEVHDVGAVNEEDKMRVREAQFRNVSVEVSAWIGKTRLSFGELGELRPGHIIELDQAVGAPALAGTASVVKAFLPAVVADVVAVRHRGNGGGEGTVVDGEGILATI